jgi:hypothetical protein
LNFPGNYRQPALLVEQDRGGDLAPRQPGDQLIADPEHRVVPAVGHELDRQAGQIGVLPGEQPPDQVRRHVHVGGGHRIRHAANCNRSGLA